MDRNFIYEEIISLEGEDGKKIARLVITVIDEKTADISSTFVDDSLRGQGIASKLMQAAADKIREEGKKTYASCSYAEKWFEKHLDYHDIYLK